MRGLTHVQYNRDVIAGFVHDLPAVHTTLCRFPDQDISYVGGVDLRPRALY